MVFVEALRAAIIADDNRIGGWLAALTDDRIGPALHLMHTDPTRRWTIPTLAETVQMSRWGFTDRFRTLVGTSPLFTYLLRVRMHIAGRELRRSSATVSAIGAASGYISDAAFSNAFTRVMGSSPVLASQPARRPKHPRRNRRNRGRSAHRWRPINNHPNVEPM